MNALVLGEKGYAQAIRAWKFSKSSGSQTMPRLERKKKVRDLGYCYYCTYRGKKVHFSKISPDCPRKKTFSLCGHDWEHMWTTPHLAQPLSIVLSLSLSPSLLLSGTN